MPSREAFLVYIYERCCIPSGQYNLASFANKSVAFSRIEWHDLTGEPDLGELHNIPEFLQMMKDHGLIEYVTIPGFVSYRVTLTEQGIAIARDTTKRTPSS